MLALRQTMEHTAAMCTATHAVILPGGYQPSPMEWVASAAEL